jgi:ABC-2 type transport system ATP-binding protein
MSEPVLETVGLGKRYGRRWALRHCTLALPRGGVVGLVGANGAGKTTLLHLAVGLLPPTEGSIAVLGSAPGSGPDALAQVGFLGQDAPLYGSLTVAEHLHLGARLNPAWDHEVASRRIAALGLDPRQRAGRLSGGQRAQLALTLAIAKRPELLVLDEPVASLDPLARRALLGDVMELVAEHGPTVIMSSHSLADVERVCDHLVVLADGRVREDGPVDELLADHKLLTGGRRAVATLPGDLEVIDARHTDRQTTVLVRTHGPVLDPHWVVADVGLEELVLAYMSASPGAPDAPRLTAVGA